MTIMDWYNHGGHVYFECIEGVEGNREEREKEEENLAIE